MTSVPAPLDSVSANPPSDGAQPVPQRFRITPPAGIPAMLKLPEAGHRIARRWAAVALLLYVGLALLLIVTVAAHESIWEFFGFGATKNWMIAALILGGMAVTAYAFGRVFQDISQMKVEESDVEWVNRTGREGLPWVFVDPMQRDQAFTHGWTTFPKTAENSIETLTDDRVRRVQSAQRADGGARVSIPELRAIAEKRTSRYGEFARYMSSLLLLLAVLGTFAGVKSALPGLIDALQSQFTTNNTAQLTGPLNAVAGAFGGNALALVGALALGLAAQGLAFGRRNLLERLELVSVEYIYGDETAAGADPMHAAATSLESSARELRSLSAIMEGVESGLDQLGTDFRSALDHLAEDLRDLADHQHESLYRQTGQTLDALQRRVGEMAGAIEGNAHTSARLIDSVQLRADEARAAIEELQRNHQQMARALDSFGATAADAQRMFEQADKRFELMSTAATQLSTSSQDLSNHVAELHAVVATAGSTSERTADAFAQALTSKVAELRDVVDAATKANGRMSETLSAILSQVREGDDRTREALLGLGKAIEAQSASVAQSVARAAPGQQSYGAPVQMVAERPPAGIQETAAVLQELRAISGQLSALEELRADQRATRWTVPGVIAASTVVVVAAMEFLARTR